MPFFPGLDQDGSRLSGESNMSVPQQLSPDSPNGARVPQLAPLAVLLRAPSGCQKSKSEPLFSSREPWPQIGMCHLTLSSKPPQCVLNFSDW